MCQNVKYHILVCVCVLVTDEAFISVYIRVSVNTCTPDFADKAA